MKKRFLFYAAVFLMLLFIGGSALAQTGQRNNLGKVLILYYSWSDSANTEGVAKILQGLTNADIIKVEPATPFPDLAYRPMTQWVKEQQEKKSFPAIKNLGVDIASYDFIFVGTPVWWGTVALPIASLLSQIDFSGKPVTCFATAGSGPGATLSDFGKQVKNAQVRQGICFNNVANDRQIDTKVSQWVNGLQR
jgi:flavodoxin